MGKHEVSKGKGFFFVLLLFLFFSIVCFWFVLTNLISKA